MAFQIKPPAQFSFKAADWPAWIRRWDRYHSASGLKEKEEEVQIDTFVYTMGDKAEDILKSLQLPQADGKKYEKVYDGYKNYFVKKHNVIYERAKFNMRMQEKDEKVDDFITSLWTLSEHCKYGTLQEEMIRDRIVVGIRCDDSSERMQLDENLTLEKAITIARQGERQKDEKQLLRPDESKSSVDHLYSKPGHSSKKNKSKKQTKHKSDGQSKSRKCKWCGYTPSHPRSACPAKDEKCDHCHKKGHYASVCFTKKRKHVNEVKAEESGDDSDDSFFLGSISEVDHVSSINNWAVDLMVGNCEVRFKIDTGADVTCLPASAYHPSMGEIKATKKALQAPAHHPLTVTGMINTQLRGEGKATKQVVYLVEGLEKPLLGTPAIDDLHIVERVHAVSIVDVKSKFPNVFKGLGTLSGKYTIKLRPDAVPFALTTPRRIAQPLLPKVKQQLLNMENDGIITRVTEPTDWCAGIVIVPKPQSDQVRICVDLTKLNDAVQRELYVMPSVEESLAKLAGAKFFTKLDANNGFWQVRLSESSAKMTTFITPFGRFYFNRLPYGLNSAPEYFMRTMAQAIDGIEGVVCQVDDILVFGSTEEEHDQRLEAVMQALAKAGITLNEKKCEVFAKSISFLGHKIDGHGVRADNNKVVAVEKMKVPENPSDVRRFLGMVNHLGKFIPHLATKTKPLRDLLVEKNEWTWEQTQQKAFNDLKAALQSDVVLKLYDPNKDSLVSADSSSYGLGAVLLQKQEDGHFSPVAYASRALTPTEQRYAQVEKEALATTWACERFNMYILGRTFEIETDHKPLVALLGSKLLDELPPRILRFRLRLMKYSYKIYHVPGKQIATADTLSRAPVRDATPSEDMHDQAEAYVNLIIDNLPVTEKRLEEIKLHTSQDEVLRQVIQYVETGWPVHLYSVPGAVKPYYPYAGDLTVQEGLLLKGQRLVIPATLRLDMLDRIHAGHQGIVKCRDRAKQSIWWPGLGRQLEEVVKSCSTCATTTQQRHEPMIPTELPQRPWQKLGTDLFDLKGNKYLLVIDYFSRYVEVVKLTSTTSKDIIERMKSLFARHGIPELVVSDNGPQYSSAEFAKFSQLYGFTHMTSSPKYAQSNGEAERAVQTIKNLLKKASDPYMALLCYRTTPLNNGSSPAQLLMGRQLRSNLPMIPSQLQPSWPDLQHVRQREEVYKSNMKEHYDRHRGARRLKRLLEGDKVYIPDMKSSGTVTGSTEQPRSYTVATPTAEIRRNRQQIIQTTSATTTNRPSTSDGSATMPRRSTRQTKPVDRLNL